MWVTKIKQLKPGYYWVITKYASEPEVVEVTEHLLVFRTGVRDPISPMDIRHWNNRRIKQPEL